MKWCWIVGSFWKVHHGPESEVFSCGKDGETGDVGFIVDGAGHRPRGKQAARSQSDFLDGASHQSVNYF